MPGLPNPPIIPPDPVPPAPPGRPDIVSLVRWYVGCSLSNRRDDLASLVTFPGDNPAQDVLIHTNCAMFVLGIWRATNCQHPLLLGRYKNQMALGWALRIAADAGALHGAHTGAPAPGDVIHYGTPGKNNDHLEFCLSDPDERRLIDHAGGGRPNNAITASNEPSDYTVNAWRPLLHWIDSTRACAYTPDK